MDCKTQLCGRVDRDRLYDARRGLVIARNGLKMAFFALHDQLRDRVSANFHDGTLPWIKNN